MVESARSTEASESGNASAEPMKKRASGVSWRATESIACAGSTPERCACGQESCTFRKSLPLPQPISSTLAGLKPLSACCNMAECTGSNRRCCIQERSYVDPQRSKRSTSCERCLLFILYFPFMTTLHVYYQI